MALAISGNFERSSIDAASCTIDGTSITLAPRRQSTSPDTDQYLMWFFQLTDASGVQPTFSISDTGLYVGSYISAYRPVYSYDRSTWVEFPAPSATNPTLTFAPAAAFTGDVYVAMRIPWGMTELAAWLSALGGDIAETPSAIAASALPTYVFAQSPEMTDDLGRTIAAQHQYAFKLGNGSTPVVLMAGTHAGEDPGNWSLKGAVEYLLGGDAAANRLMDAHEFFVYPMVNPGGRTGGHFRGNWESTVDPNRDWDDGSTTTMANNAAAVAADIASCLACFDFHSFNDALYSYYRQAGANGDALIAALDEVSAGLSWHVHGTQDSDNNVNHVLTDFSGTYGHVPEIGQLNEHSEADSELMGELHMRALDLLVGGDASAPALGLHRLHMTGACGHSRG